MPTSLCPPNTPHASFSRRSFFALAATAASYAALGPVAFESVPLDHASQHPLSHQAWAAETRSPHNTIEGILGATKCALDELKAHEYDSYYLGTPMATPGPTALEATFPPGIAGTPTASRNQMGRLT